MYAYFVALILFYRKYLPVLPCMWLLHLLAFSPDVWFNVRHILLTVLIMIYDPVWNVAEQLISRE
jgi:hypothetical protein